MGSSHSTPTPTGRDPALPADVVQRVASFLLGVEVIQYAHACPPFFVALNSPHDWAMRLEPALRGEDDPYGMPAWCCREKAIYAQQRALLFGGTARHSWRDRLRINPRPACGDFVALESRLLMALQQFSFELTFSVSPIRPHASTCDGGILVGFQSTHCAESSTPTEFFSFVSIDTNGGLHLAAEQIKPTTSVAATVTFGEWHHLVLAFDGRYLRAFLDGELRFFKRMPRGFPWATLPHGQLGTGFGYDPNRTLSTYNDQRVAWRPFHGLVAQAHVWGMTVDEDSARRLARGEKVTQEPAFAVHQAPDGPRRVVTSRPCERYAQILRI